MPRWKVEVRNAHVRKKIRAPKQRQCGARTRALQDEYAILRADVRPRTAHVGHAKLTVKKFRARLGGCTRLYQSNLLPVCICFGSH